MARPSKPRKTIARAKTLRKTMSIPEAMMWQRLRGSPQGLRFRRQHPAGPFILDFFCARANLAIEIDGGAHDMGDRPERDARRDLWLREHKIETIHISAKDVLRDCDAVAEMIMKMVEARLTDIGKTPPSDAFASATSPSQDDRED